MLSSYHWHYIKVALFLYLLTLPMSPFTVFFLWDFFALPFFDCYLLYGVWSFGFGIFRILATIVKALSTLTLLRTKGANVECETNKKQAKSELRNNNNKNSAPFFACRSIEFRISIFGALNAVTDKHCSTNMLVRLSRCGFHWLELCIKFAIYLLKRTMCVATVAAAPTIFHLINAHEV